MGRSVAVPISQPVPDPSSVANRITFQIKSPTGSAALVSVTVSVDFPSFELDPSLTEAQKYALMQRLVDFFSGLNQVVPPVGGTKTFVSSQAITPTP